VGLRNNKGYTLIELMVSISILAVVLTLIYSNYNRGLILFNKSLQFGRLQTNARASLEQIVNNIKLASRDMIYVGDAFNANIPLPDDYAFGKPYIYFAIPQKTGSKTADAATEEVTPYDYYLYYIAYAKNSDGDFVKDRAKLRLFKVLKQDGQYTVNNILHWPVMPPSLLGQANYEAEANTVKTGFANDVEYGDLSDEFSLYQSEFAYFYYNTNYEHLFKIKVKMVDPNSNTHMEFETAVTPRN
jgi:prepilin-type N-terminal cleavage/methylation domain-containing protein